jgi:YndJ-like protein
VLLAGGPIVVAGLGLPLAERVLAPGALRAARWGQPGGAALALVALALEPGVLAGVLACGWLAVCLAATGGAAVVAWRRRPPPWPPAGDVGDVAVLAGLAFLSVGGSWLVISRFGWRPLDLSTDIVRLTAVHFHYAGFALPVMGAAAFRASSGAARRVLALALGAAIAGPPLVAAGFTTESAVLQVGGAVVVTVAAWGVAAGTAAAVRSVSRAHRGAAVLLGLSSASPLVAMVLAVQWALAQHASIPALGVDDMARTHGLLNGLGFVIAGLAGWSLVSPAPPPSPLSPASGTEATDPVQALPSRR